jgi:zinc transport system substrate-binding protein
MRLLLLILCLQPALLCAAPRVVTSIPPLQEIAAAVMDDIGIPEVIIDAHASAHHFALKPSHMERLQRADLVIWVDRNFESGFNRIPAALPTSTTGLELLPALGIDGDDGHFWYAPALLERSIDLIATELMRLDSENQQQYSDNARLLAGEIRAWRQRIETRFKHRAPRLLTAHDFLRPFAADFEWFEIESIYDQHDAHGGLKDLRRLEAILRERPPACLLTLEAELPALAESLADKYRLRIVRVNDSPASDSSKIALIQRLERLQTAIANCDG